MKKILSIFVMMAMMVVSWSQKVELSGTLTGLPEGVKVMLAEAVGSKLEVRDTLAVAQNGKYKLSLKAEKPTLFILQPQMQKGPQVHVMVMPDDRGLTLNMAYDQQHNYMRVVSSKGSRNMELYQRFNAALYESVKEFGRINALGASGVIAADKLIEHRHSWLSGVLLDAQAGQCALEHLHELVHGGLHQIERPEVDFCGIAVEAHREGNRHAERPERGKDSFGLLLHKIRSGLPVHSADGEQVQILHLVEVCLCGDELRQLCGIDSGFIGEPVVFV